MAGRSETVPAGNATVTLRSTATTTDSHGDSTTETTETVLPWAIITPRASTERTDPHAPAVITAATLYGPGGLSIGADDVFVVADHSPAMNGEWQAEGLAGDWKSPYTTWHPGIEVALQRAGSA